MNGTASERARAETAVLNGITVTYRAAGDGPPVVLIHGLAEDHRSWGAAQDALTEYRTYAYDLRGHGQTTAGECAGTVEQLRDDLIAFLETVTGPAACVGFSLGGVLVLSAAAARPDLVANAVVLGTSTVVGRSAAGFYAERIALFRGDGEAAKAEALRADTAAALHNPDSDLDQVTADRLKAVGDGAGYINASTAMASLNGAPLTSALAAVKADVTVIGADHDTFCPKKAADIILDALPSARYAEISSAGHLMLVDQPGQSIDLIRRALDG